MSRRPHRGRRVGPKRKSDIYKTSLSLGALTSATASAVDVMAQFKTDFGAIPYQATLGPIEYYVTSIAAGTAAVTDLNTFNIGFLVGPATLDSADLDPVTDANKFWYVRKFELQNNSSPAGIPWATQGIRDDFKVRTMRTLKVLGDTLWLAGRADLNGFTSLTVSVAMRIKILYA